jgi:hypothetical protein
MPEHAVASVIGVVMSIILPELQQDYPNSDSFNRIDLSRMDDREDNSAKVVLDGTDFNQPSHWVNDSALNLLFKKLSRRTRVMHIILENFKRPRSVHQTLMCVLRFLRRQVAKMQEARESFEFTITFQNCNMTIASADDIFVLQKCGSQCSLRFITTVLTTDIVAGLCDSRACVSYDRAKFFVSTSRLVSYLWRIECPRGKYVSISNIDFIAEILSLIHCKGIPLRNIFIESVYEEQLLILLEFLEESLLDDLPTLSVNLVERLIQFFYARIQSYHEMVVDERASGMIRYNHNRTISSFNLIKYICNQYEHVCSVDNILILIQRAEDDCVEVAE